MPSALCKALKLKCSWLKCDKAFFFNLVFPRLLSQSWTVWVLTSVTCRDFSLTLQLQSYEHQSSGWLNGVCDLHYHVLWNPEVTDHLGTWQGSETLPGNAVALLQALNYYTVWFSPSHSLLPNTDLVRGSCKWLFASKAPQSLQIRATTSFPS